MSGYSINDIASAINGHLLRSGDNSIIEHLLIDSRKLIFRETSLFFAIPGPRRDGHDFLQELYGKGVRNFIVSRQVELQSFENSNIILVANVTDALQKLAAHHRSLFHIPVIGITGSNGKTIVKEWLNQLLQDKFNIVRSPKSYNSQVGVPLSVWQMKPFHELAIFEAGISKPDEMQKLEKVIKPTIGILTNISEAHGEGFMDKREKAIEKAQLFSNCEKIIYAADSALPHVDFGGTDRNLLQKKTELFSWSRNGPATLRIIKEVKEAGKTKIDFEYRNKIYSTTIYFTDQASVDNLITCYCVLLSFNYDHEEIERKLQMLQPVSMRLELKNAINNCSLINDSYSADPASLKIALEFLSQQKQHPTKTVILSDFLQTGLSDEELYSSISTSLNEVNVNRFFGIGEIISAHRSYFNGIAEETQFFPDTENFISQFQRIHFNNESILLKGARVFHFEDIDQLLQQRSHQTVLEIDLDAIAHNLKLYQRSLKPSTKIMVMVKAFAYGSGSYEIANLLQFHKVDYLGVAYADEGVELRKAGITMPVMVMNTERSSLEDVITFKLEPVIYSFQALDRIDHFLRSENVQHYPLHIEIETGMNRLGFKLHELSRLSEKLKSKFYLVRSVFSHLAASEDPQHDAFTALQAELYNKAADQLQTELQYPFIRHLANTAAIKRHPDLQFDMVRLGIGLYGVNTVNEHESDLIQVSTLKTTIAQINQVSAGETVSYGRSDVVEKDSVIATVCIGYADGYPRHLSNGKGKMWVNGYLAPVIGSICMDMTMIDVTGIPGVTEEEEVIVFGKELPVEQVAHWANTISYEILTGVSQRVKRVYLHG